MGWNSSLMWGQTCMHTLSPRPAWEEARPPGEGTRGHGGQFWLQARWRPLCRAQGRFVLSRLRVACECFASAVRHVHQSPCL